MTRINWSMVFVWTLTILLGVSFWWVVLRLEGAA